MKRLLQTINSISVNADRVSRKSFRGKEHIIVSGVSHMIGDAVMNGIQYPLSETEKLNNSLGNKRIVMPVSHPVGDEGEFISASDPLALMSNFIGSFAFNFSMQGDKLISDIAIDPVVAGTSEDGKKILNAIETGEPMDVSTGFFLEIEDRQGFGPDGEPFDGVASNLFLDHVAFLPDEVGAKNKSEGVGLFTNSATDLQGKKIDTDVAELFSNSSSPAMRLPLAPTGHTWDASQAVNRVREFSKSTEKPSTNYRKFFLAFDQGDVENFGAYKLPFVDIIDGTPHAVKNAIDNAKARLGQTDISDSDKASALSAIESYQARFEGMTTNKSTLADKFKSLLAWAVNKGYTDEDGAQPEITNNNQGDSQMDRTKIIALLASKGFSVNAEATDEELEAKLTEAMTTKADPAPEVVETASNALTIEDVTTAVNAAIKPLQEQLNAKSDNELEQVAEQVAAMNKGISKETAKAMGLDACNQFLAANGQPAFNSVSRMPTFDNGNGKLEMTLPGLED